LQFALRDRGITSLAICGIGFRDRHRARLFGTRPISESCRLLSPDACGAGMRMPDKRTLDQLRFIGDALMTNEAAFSAALDARV